MDGEGQSLQLVAESGRCCIIEVKRELQKKKDILFLIILYVIVACVHVCVRVHTCT